MLWSIKFLGESLEIFKLKGKSISSVICCNCCCACCWARRATCPSHRSRQGLKDFLLLLDKELATSPTSDTMRARTKLCRTTKDIEWISNILNKDPPECSSSALPPLVRPKREDISFGWTSIVQMTLFVVLQLWTNQLQRWTQLTWLGQIKSNHLQWWTLFSDSELAWSSGVQRRAAPLTPPSHNVSLTCVHFSYFFFLQKKS